MATTTTRLMTVEEYEEIPNPPGGVHELYHGEPITVPFPQQPHLGAQWQLRRLLDAAAGDAGVVDKEFPYRPLPEHECWGADVAYLTRARWDSIDQYLMGSPELVIEVLSPSNTMSKLRDKRKICLETGSREFWIVDLDLREVEVSAAGGPTIIYSCGQEIPLFFGGRLAVDAIFS